MVADESQLTLAAKAMGAFLPEPAKQRLEATLNDLEHRFSTDVQRLSKWGSFLEYRGPSGEEEGTYEAMGPRSLILGPIVWDGPIETRQLTRDDITSVLRVKTRELLQYYVHRLAGPICSEWMDVRLSPSKFKEQMHVVQKAILVYARQGFQEADEWLRLGLDVNAELVAIEATVQEEIRTTCEKYDIMAALYGTTEKNTASPNTSAPTEAVTVEPTDPEAATDGYKTVMGRNIDRLRQECGWSFDWLAHKSGLDKKLILGHVNEGKGANPRTLKTYADAFSRGLERPISVAELKRQ